MRVLQILPTLSMSSPSNSTFPSSASAPIAMSEQAATESLLASPSASTDDCPMLRLLALDSGSMFQLLRFLPLLSMASLYPSCRQWSEWLRVGGKIVRRYRPVKPSRFHQLLGSWVQLHITQLNLILESDDPTSRDDAAKLRELDAMLAVIPQTVSFPRLTSLELHCPHSRTDDAVVRSALAALGPRLQVLMVYTSRQHTSVVPVNSFMRSLDAVPKLTELKISGPFYGQEIDFSCLPSVAESLLTLQLIPEQATPWRRTPMQSRLLAQCTRLTKLDVGSYGDIAGRPVESDKELGGMRIYVDARCSAGTADTVEWLWLNQSKMTSELFSSLARLPSLRSIWPAMWSAEFAPELWSQLPRFEQLEQFSVCASHVENADPANLKLSLDSFIDPLTACTKLNALQLSKMNISTSQLARITGALTQLTRLTFVDLRVESVEPLRAASNLFHLRLLLCLDAKGEFVQWRSALPPMPSITELYLQDNPALCSLTREEAEPLNEALRAKMPNLAMDKFFQTPNPK